MGRIPSGALLIAGVIGPPLFVAVAFVAGATRPAYDPIRLPVSLLALGPGGWVQSLNFVVFGALSLCFAVGLRRVMPDLGVPTMAGPILIAVVALGFLGAGVFATDPGGGYPPGVHEPASTHGTLHDVASLLVFLGLPVAALVFARWFAASRHGRWAAYSFVTAILLAGGFGLLLVALNGTTDLAPIGGLIQRAVIVVGWLWLTLLALFAWTNTREAHP